MSLVILSALLVLVALAPSKTRADEPLDSAVARAFATADRQLRATTSALPVTAYPSSTDQTGGWVTTGPSSWTAGFLPGALWLMYEATGDAYWRSQAEARQAGLLLQASNAGTHDLGFMIFNSFGQAYRLTGEPRARAIVFAAASTLAQRHSPIVNAIRSWNNPRSAPPSDFRVIVDSLMNMELLFWSAEHGRTPYWRRIATDHATRVLEDHVRPDGSTYHLVIYDSTTGAVKSKTTAQGYSPESTWSRGQAWAIYGFTVAYRYTGKQRFLRAAKRTAEYFLSRLPPDAVPFWDFDAPGIPLEPRDSSAAAIAASALLELSRYVNARQSQRYLAAAERILLALCSPDYLAAEGTTAAILLHGTANRPGGRFDQGLIWGDYYFLEALLRYKALQRGHDASPSAATTQPVRRRSDEAASNIRMHGFPAGAARAKVASDARD